MKNTIFSISLLIVFQNVSHAMEEKPAVDKDLQLHILSLLPPWYDSHDSYRSKKPIPQQKKLSKKAQKIENFLNSFNNVEPDKKNEIIEYFNQNNSIPIFIKHSQQIPNPPSSLLQSIANSSCESLLGYSLEELKDAWALEKLKKNDNNYLDISTYNVEYKIDKKTTEIASILRSNTNINPQTNIPIFKKDFCYENRFNGDWLDSYYYSMSNYKTYSYFIKMNSFLNKKYLDTIPLRVGHELSHIERGCSSPHIKNLLLMKALLGTAAFMITYFFFKSGNTSWTNAQSIVCTASGLEAVVLGTLFKGYFQQKEEKACDLGALELIESSQIPISNQILKKYFSLKPIITDKFSGNNWTIQEMKIEQLKEPEAYTTWEQKLFAAHPSPAERLRYCQNYAEQLKNPGKYFLGYRIRK